jgi:hypothetical protein
MILEKDHNRVARWNKENNCWDVGVQTLYRWADTKKQPVSDWYKDLTDALNFIIQHDIQSH